MLPFTLIICASTCLAYYFVELMLWKTRTLPESFITFVLCVTCCLLTNIFANENQVKPEDNYFEWPKYSKIIGKCDSLDFPAQGIDIRFITENFILSKEGKDYISSLTLDSLYSELNAHTGLNAKYEKLIKNCKNRSTNPFLAEAVGKVAVMVVDGDTLLNEDEKHTPFACLRNSLIFYNIESTSIYPEMENYAKFLTWHESCYHQILIEISTRENLAMIK